MCEELHYNWQRAPSVSISRVLLVYFVCVPSKLTFKIGCAWSEIGRAQQIYRIKFSFFFFVHLLRRSPRFLQLSHIFCAALGQVARLFCLNISQLEASIRTVNRIDYITNIHIYRKAKLVNFSVIIFSWFCHIIQFEFHFVPSLFRCYFPIFQSKWEAKSLHFVSRSLAYFETQKPPT